MIKLSRRTIAVVCCLVISALAVSAQQQGSGQFSQMREKYKYTFQLMNMARNIGEIDKNPKYALTSDQAKKVLAVLKPLRSKPKLTQDQAKDTLKKLKPIFNTNQLNAMAKIKPKPQRQRPQGQSPQGANQRPRQRMDPNAMKDFNPFYAKASANDEFAKRRAARWNEFFTGLEKKAKSQKPAAAPAKKTTTKK